jgi:hypothetical protein
MGPSLGQELHVGRHSGMSVIVRYAFNVGRLLLRRRITWQTFKYSLRARPIAVAGRGGGYIVDPEFD